MSEMNRRSFVGGSFAALAAMAANRESSLLFAGKDNELHNLYWGDIHNHNECGLAKGSLERAIDLARGHLDFWAATGHSWWHDMPDLPGTGREMFLEGFERHRKFWPKTRGLVEESTDDEFVAILGYEWHSSAFGDYCMLFPEDNRELYLPDHANKLLDFADSKNALAITHHVGYKKGWRGANFDFHRPVTSPVVEVMSEHGCTMSLTSPHDMVRHSMGGRSSQQVIERQLESGMRFGFVGSSDTHRGYPGAYGEGVVGIWAPELSRRAIFAALRKRRTYATSGERIAVEFAINGQPMGSELPTTADRQIDIRVEGQNTLQMIELVCRGQVIERHFPQDHSPGPLALPGRAKCRIRYGWGPWAQFESGRICMWDMKIRLEGGQIRRAYPCFQAAPFDEELRDTLKVIDEQTLHLVSPTSRVKSFEEDPTKSVVLDLEGGPDAEIVVQTTKPAEQTVRAKLGYLRDDNEITFTGGFGAESFIIEQLVGPSDFGATLRWHDRRNAGGEADWYYVRVTQHNGHCAWSSPIWVG
ncbi:MAG: hypothetical protein CMJ50_06250 [Planctomycetaceae bacterium]|jgi:hypothetical protein|nr:hypothetical protein [Planctomycetaceae bacterium]